MPQAIDRRQQKATAKSILRGAQVNPRAITALYLFLALLLDQIPALFSAGAGLLSGGFQPLRLFLTVAVDLAGTVLSCGWLLYCMGVRRGQRKEYATLGDGFPFAGKIIALSVLEGLLLGLRLLPASVCVYAVYFSGLPMSSTEATVCGLITLLSLYLTVTAFYSYRFCMYNLCRQPELGSLRALRLSALQTRGYRRQLFFLDLSFLGGLVLSLLPSLYLLSASLNPEGQNPAALLSLTLLSNVWNLVVSVFFLPYFRLTDLGYFEQIRLSREPEAQLPPL